MNSDDILSKLIEYFVAVEVYVKEEGNGPNPLVKKQYIYPEGGEDQDFINNISLFAFPSAKTYDISKTTQEKNSNNNVFKDSSKDHYDITEVECVKPKNKNNLDDIKCHDFILTNQYGEKIYASCIRTRKLPLKWDMDLARIKCNTKINNEYYFDGISKKSSEFHHNKDSSDCTAYYSNENIESLSNDHINSFCSFNEYGSNHHIDENSHNKPPIVPLIKIDSTNVDDNKKHNLNIIRENVEELAFLRCKNDKKFSESNTALSKIPTIPTSSILRLSTHAIYDKSNDSIDNSNLVLNDRYHLGVRHHFISQSHLHLQCNASSLLHYNNINGPNSHNNHNNSNHNHSNHNHNSHNHIHHNNINHCHINGNHLNYHSNNQENINSSTACILSQYTNLKQQQHQQALNNLYSSTVNIDHNMMSRSNLHHNFTNARWNSIRFQSSYNIDSNSSNIRKKYFRKNQIRGYSSITNDYNVYNFTQSTSNLTTNNSNLLHQYFRREEFTENRLSPKHSKISSIDDNRNFSCHCLHDSLSSTSSTSSSSGSCSREEENEEEEYADDDDDDNEMHKSEKKLGSMNLATFERSKSSVIDTLNLDIINMEDLAQEKILHTKQANQSLLYNLDLCVNESSLLLEKTTSVNSLMTKKTITSYILISRRPIFSIMQKCLIEIYLLAKYSLQSNKNNNDKKEVGTETAMAMSNPISKKLLKKGIIESFLAYLMHTIFLPSLNSPFTIQIELPLSKEILEIKPQNKTEICTLYHPVFHLFQLLSINNIISIFTHMTLEKSVIFYSENPSILTPICETFLSFLEPLEWRMVYIPIVPESVIESLKEAPITFIMGYVTNKKESDVGSLSSLNNLNNDKGNKGNHLHPKSASFSRINGEKNSNGHSPNLSSINERNDGHTRDRSYQKDLDHSFNDFKEQSSEEDFLCVDLDSDEIFNLPEHRIHLPYESCLRNDLRKILYNDTPSLKKEIYLNSQKKEYSINKEACVESIRKCFYHWFVTILYNYQSFYINDGDFNIMAFRSRFSDSCSDYINRFTETSMFTYFIEKKYEEKTNILSSSSIKPKDYFDFCSNKLLGIPFFNKPTKIDSDKLVNTLNYDTLLLDLPKNKLNTPTSSSSNRVKLTSPKNTTSNNSLYFPSKLSSIPNISRDVLDISKESIATLYGSESNHLEISQGSLHSHKLKNEDNNFNLHNPNKGMDRKNDSSYYFDINLFEYFNTKYQNNYLLSYDVKSAKMTNSFPLLFKNINRLIDLQINYCKTLKLTNNNKNNHSTIRLNTSGPKQSTSSSMQRSTQSSSTFPSTLTNKENPKESHTDNENEDITNSISNSYRSLKEILPLSSYEGGYSYTTSSLSSISSSMNKIYGTSSSIIELKSNAPKNSISSLKQEESYGRSISNSNNSINSNSNYRCNRNSNGSKNDLSISISKLSYDRTSTLSAMIIKSNASLPLSYRFRLQQLLWIRGLLLQEYSLDIFQSIQDFCWAYNFCDNETLLEMIENSFLQLNNQQKCHLFKKLNCNFFLAFEKIFLYNVDIRTMYDAYVQCSNMD